MFKMNPSAFALAAMLASCMPMSARAVECFHPGNPYLTGVDDLVAYWPLSKDGKDYSGNQKHLSTPVFNDAKKPSLVQSGGPRDQGYHQFTRSNGRVSVLAVEDFPFNQYPDYTIEFWFRVDQATDNANWFVSYSTASYSNEVFLSTGHQNQYKCDAGRHGEVKGNLLNGEAMCEDTGEWRHFAYTNDGDDAVLYIDGVSIGSKSNPKTPGGPGVFAIGAELDKVAWPSLGLAYSQGLVGAMAEVRVWSKALTQPEVSTSRDTAYTCTSYTEGVPCSASEAELCHPLAYCELEEDDNAFKPKCKCPSGLIGDGFGPLGCHNQIPSVSCPVLSDSDNGANSTDRRSGGTIVGGPLHLGGYWPLSVTENFKDRSGNGHTLTPLNSGPTMAQTDAGAPFEDGYAEFDPAGRSQGELEALYVKDFDPGLVGSDGSYTWEFWYRVDGDTAPSAQWFVSYAVGGRGDYKDNNFFMSTGHAGSNRGKCDAGLHGEVKGTAAVCYEGLGWKHIAFVHDGTAATGTLYVDGAQQVSRGYDKGAMLCQNRDPAECVGGGTLMFGGELDGLDPELFGNNIREPIQFLQGAMTEVRFWTEARTQEEILAFKDFRLSELECGEFVSGEQCDEAQANQCHNTAYCESIGGNATCFCEMGMIGSGYGEDGCRAQGWTVRTVYEHVPAVELAWLSDPAAVETMAESLKECFSADAVHFQRGVAPFSDAMHFPYASHALMVNALYDDEPSAAEMAALATAAPGCFTAGTVGNTGTRKYTWNYQTTAAEQMVQATGLTVDAVSFETSCADSGCWVIEVTYTTGGKDAFNSFYLPNAVGDDTLSYDYTYDAVTMNSFLPKNFPCRTHEYIESDGTVPASLPTQVTTCCLIDDYVATDGTDTANGFVNDYRPTVNFVDWVTDMEGLLCQSTNFPYVAVVDRAEYNETEANPSPFIDVNFPWHSTVPHRFLDGKFQGMPVSPGVNSTTTLDPFFYQYKATIKLDEVELRRKAGQLRGTVGVEHTVDTFLGFVNFRPTGRPVLDSFATQVNLHLEKTSFFSVSTHGTNDYTFLEYVNMRLISIYNEDADFSGLTESAARTVRTDPSGNANYVQVTFTMGAQYSPSDTEGLIPLDSVRAGRGTFLDSTPLQHLCSMYDESAGPADPFAGLGSADTIGVFDAMLAQGCGPQSTMCSSPSSVPDQFVSFNIPLGFEVFDGEASSDLSNNIFVSMVISALDSTGCADPNTGCEPLQAKTTLDASIPIVAGGVNIFCDGVTAKTDLKDVANADIIVGSANSQEELTRLRILADVASTDLDAVPSAQIDTPSIESGLMTLVLRGDSAYFSPANTDANTLGYSLELDDLITLHLMTDGSAPAETDAECASSSSVDCQLRALLAQSPEDNSDTNGLLTEGYKLNGAFLLDLNRGLGIAQLEPSSELLALCPFNPPRPDGGMVVESCITRRDVRSRTYPVRVGADGPTAMEILKKTIPPLTDDDVAPELAVLEGQVAPRTCACATGADCCEPAFMQMILGGNDYGRELAVDFVKAIHGKYALNGRFKRAYWINPGYEWTPTQAGGSSIFSVSQKLYLFALITMDQNIGRRSSRMLLQAGVDPTAESGSGVGGAQLTADVGRKSIMAGAFNVPEEKVAVFAVEMQLTEEEACMSDLRFAESARATVADYSASAASALLTVQVLAFTRELNGVSCSRRRVRKLLSGFSDATATVQMLVVYPEKGAAIFNPVAFADMPGISSVVPDPSNAPVITIDPEYKNENPGKEPEGGSSSSMALIAGVCGGVGGAVLVAAGALMYMRSRRPDSQVVTAVQTVDVATLKAQLADDSNA